MLKRVGQDAYSRVLAEHDRLIRAGISGHGGREINTTGDGFFAASRRPARAWRP
jgi:class 3 adenylate cyclase